MFRIGYIRLFAVILLYVVSSGAQEGAGVIGQPGDSLAAQDSLTDSSAAVYVKDTSRTEVEVNVRSRSMALLAWPFENVVQPVFSLLIYPMKPPLQYASSKNLVDKGVSLISFGDEGQVFIYPTFNMKPGSGSSIGMTYRHRNMLRGPDYFVADGQRFVNGDWAMSLRYTKKKFLDTRYWIGGGLRVREDRDRTFRVPGGDAFMYADSSVDLRMMLGRSLNENWSWEFLAGFYSRLYDLPDLTDTILVEDDPFGRQERGVYQDMESYPAKFTLSYDTRDVPFAPTRGDKLALSYERTFVSDYQGPNTDSNITQGNHDYNNVEVKWQRYFLLGEQRYALTTRESREQRRELRNMSLSKAMNLLRPEQIRQTLLERKVLATQIRFRQMWEAEEGQAPFFAFNGAGANSPLRGYPDYRFADFAVLGFSGEYRWPLDKLVDGVVFNEYTVLGDSWNNLQWKDAVNSWGFGIRVRKPDMFLTRFQLGFHGLHGFSMILTTAPEYD